MGDIEMTEREKIISLYAVANESAEWPDTLQGYYDKEDEHEIRIKEAFYNLVRNEALEEALDLKPSAFHIFGLGAQQPQGETRDVIEWYDASIRALKETK